MGINISNALRGVTKGPLFYADFAFLAGLEAGGKNRYTLAL